MIHDRSPRVIPEGETMADLADLAGDGPHRPLPAEAPAAPPALSRPRPRPPRRPPRRRRKTSRRRNASAARNSTTAIGLPPPMPNRNTPPRATHSQNIASSGRSAAYARPDPDPDLGVPGPSARLPPGVPM